ncbi:unnamed protein product [Pieris macdunnoughi]|nr:unnamed protein product [Pieris macdunnoughi]
MRISDTERKRNYRLRKAANLARASGSLESITASSSRSAGRSNDVQKSTQRQLTNQQPKSLAAESAQITIQPGTSSDQIEVPDEPIDLTDLPIPSMSNAPVETRDAAAPTSTTPFFEPPTIAAPKSIAQRQREYRQRIAASRTPAQAIATRISETERKRNYRLRKAANLARASGSLESITASSSLSAGSSNDDQNSTQRQLTNQQPQSLATEQQAQSTWNTKWKSSIMRFTSTFLDNDFGYTCSVCDRLWFKHDLKTITAAQLKVVSDWFIKENLQLCREEYKLVCNTCKRSLNKKSMPPLAKVNGFSYPDRPPGQAYHRWIPSVND